MFKDGRYIINIFSCHIFIFLLTIQKCSGSVTASPSSKSSNLAGLPTAIFSTPISWFPSPTAPPLGLGGPCRLPSVWLMWGSCCGSRRWGWGGRREPKTSRGREGGVFYLESACPMQHRWNYRTKTAEVYIPYKINIHIFDLIRAWLPASYCLWVIHHVAFWLKLSAHKLKNQYIH